MEKSLLAGQLLWPVLLLNATLLYGQGRDPEYDFASELLDIPCIQVGAQRLEANLALAGTNPMVFDVLATSPASTVTCNTALYKAGTLQLDRVETLQGPYAVQLDLVPGSDPFRFILDSVVRPSFGLDSFSSVEFAIPLDGAGAEGELVLEEAYPNLHFSNPVFLTWVPGSDHNIVVERGGSIRIFENAPQTATSSLFLDITDKTGFGAFDERGLLGCAFDPNYDSNRYFYCHYTRNSDGASVLSRFRASADNPLAALEDSEVQLLVVPQPQGNHNGGMVAFSPADNYLYLALGDGGGANDNHGPTGNAQDRGNLLGSIIRIDPDTDADGGYRIPADNPFGQLKCSDGPAAGGEMCGEIFHWGLRNPWRFSFDAETGNGWIGDVGQDAREEVNFWAHGEAGLNFGWACREGFIAGPKPDVATCDEASEIRDPVTDFTTGPNESVIGGYVYRGDAIALLTGKYVYGRLGDREIHVIDQSGDPDQVISTGSRAVYSFGEDIFGELYAIFADGAIQRLSVDPDAVDPSFPDLLSETGLFSSVPDFDPVPALIPYTVNSPLFSDYTDKERFIGLPPGGRITVNAEGLLEFPAGSVAVKQFDFQGRRIETRVLVKGEDEWLGYTWHWNEAQTEATLVGSAGATITLPNGANYDLPGRADCQACHNRGEAGSGNQLLGIQIAQLNNTLLYDSGIADNQLRALSHAGALEMNFTSALQLPRLPDYRDPGSGSLDARARSYLHSNCGSCHRPGGVSTVSLDLRYATPMAQRGILEQAPREGAENGAQLLLDPGNKENSVLWQRMRLTVPNQRAMPPLAHRQLHEEGIALIGEWIDSMSP